VELDRKPKSRVPPPPPCAPSPGFRAATRHPAEPLLPFDLQSGVIAAALRQNAGAPDCWAARPAAVPSGSVMAAIGTDAQSGEARSPF